MKKLAALLITPIVCFGNNSGTIDVKADVQFYASIQNAALNMTVDDYTKSQSVSLSNWSIWSNSSEPIAVQVSSVNGGALKDKVGDEIPYDLFYTSCGGKSPIKVTPTFGQNAFGLDPSVANQTICASNPGSLELVRPVLSNEPFAGNYSAEIVMTVSQAE